MTEAKKSWAKVKATKNKVKSAEPEEIIADDQTSVEEPAVDASVVAEDPVVASEDVPEPDEQPQPGAATEDVPEPDEQPQPEAVTEDAPEPDEQPQPEKVTEITPQQSTSMVSDAAPRASFMPMLAGGVIAAVIGVGVSGIVNPNGWPFGAPRDDARIEALTQQIAAQDRDIEQMTADLAKAADSAKADAAALAAEAALQAEQVGAALAAQAAQAQADLGEMLAEFDARLSGLEKRPVAESVSPEAMAAYERELKALQDAMVRQRAEVEEKSASAELKAQEAKMSAQEATNRAAFSRIETALDLGNGFAPSLAELAASGLEIPAELSTVADSGVASMAALSEQFPDLARAALATARATDTDGDTQGGLANFLKSQLGARSLEPREGSDPDAVLSRAEAALREGRLTDAMAELDTLPENARAELTDWLASATARQNALAAAQTLGQALNKK